MTVAHWSGIESANLDRPLLDVIEVPHPTAGHAPDWLGEPGVPTELVGPGPANPEEVGDVADLAEAESPIWHGAKVKGPCPGGSPRHITLAYVPGTCKGGSRIAHPGDIRYGAYVGQVEKGGFPCVLRRG